MAAPLYPLFLKLDDQRCLVVGGGVIGAGKAEELLRCGARVVAVSPAFAPPWDRLPAERLQRVVRRFASGDEAGSRLVFSATGDTDVDATVVGSCRQAGILVNVVDVPDRCDFYAGSQVRRGDLCVAVSTAGASPSLAILLRRRIEAVVPAASAALVQHLARIRPALLHALPGYGDRARCMEAVLGRVLERLDADERAGIVDLVAQELAREGVCLPLAPPAQEAA